MQEAIQENGLQNMYPPNHPLLDQIARTASHKISMLCAEWRLEEENASDLVKLALFDVVLYIDDSGSMAFEEHGERIVDLKAMLSRIAFATSLMDEDGIQVRFMNSTDQGNGIRHEQQVNDLLNQRKFSGLTPMTASLRDKIIRPLVLGPARSGQLKKPVLVITITDGQPSGTERIGTTEEHETLERLKGFILETSAELAANPRYGKAAVCYQFAQVGNDLKARDFLKRLDEDPDVGDLIDCTSSQFLSPLGGDRKC